MSRELRLPVPVHIVTGGLGAGKTRWVCWGGLACGVVLCCRKLPTFEERPVLTTAVN